MNEPNDPRSPEALTALIRGVTHQLRSPIGVLSEVVTSIGGAFDGQLDEDQRRLMVFADRGLRRLSRTADVLDLVSMLERGTFTPSLWPLDLAERARDSVGRAQALETRREVTVECELPEGLCAVTVDSAALGLGLTELTINALGHACGRVRVRLEREGGEARLSFEDDGRGVRPEELAFLFRRFTSRPLRAGLGLGLSIAHDVAVAHGGRLWLEDSTLPPGRPGPRGARFVLALPIKGDG